MIQYIKRIPLEMTKGANKKPDHDKSPNHDNKIHFVTHSGNNKNCIFEDNEYYP